MTVIDAHVHLYPPELNYDPPGWGVQTGEAHWARLCTRIRRDGRAVQGFPSATQLLRDMDAAGVERAVLLGWYWEKPETCAWQNRFYAACVRAHPDRFSAFASLHPAAGREAVLAEARRVREEGFSGLGELSPHSQRYGIDDPVLGEVLALAGELRLPVNLHVTDPAGKFYPGRIETPLADFIHIAREYSRTIFILAHWGGLLPAVEAEAAALPNLFYDTAASPRLYQPDVFTRVVKAVGRAKVLFGSDYPLILFPEESQPGFAKFLAQIAGTDLTAEERTALLGGNATTVLGLAAG